MSYNVESSAWYFYVKTKISWGFKICISVPLNVNHSDSRNDARSPNDSMEESQCVEKQDHSESTNTEGGA